MDILFVSLPSCWQREYVFVENYWMISIAQHLAAQGYNVYTLDAALKRCELIDIQNYFYKEKPKIVMYLVSKKNWEIVLQTKKNIVAEISVLLWDDSFLLNDINRYIPEDEHTININLDNLESIKTLLKATNITPVYSQNTFLVGRECLGDVLLNGGECEVIMQIPHRQCFPTDYEFNINRLIFKKNINMIKKEIITLCNYYNIRKINIINSDKFHCLKIIDEIDIFLKEQDLPYLKIGIYVTSEVFNSKMCDYIIEKRDLIYKIVLISLSINPEQITEFQRLKNNGIKLKVILELFHANATICSILFAINAIRYEDIQVSPTSLIAGNPSNKVLIQIQNILKILFFKLFFSYHQKIIEYENNVKFELRIGKSKQYDYIPKIQKQVELFSKSLNAIFLDIMENILLHSSTEDYTSAQMIINVLTQYKDKIKEVGDDIDANLFASRRV